MFSVGDKIIYPMHGAGVIQSVEEKKILGERKDYYSVTIIGNQLEILIPVDKAESIGMRPIGGHDDVEAIITALGGDLDPMENNWSKRYQDNLSLLKSGDSVNTAKVVKNLTILDRGKGLSGGEKKMLHSAKGFLISEIMAVDNKTKEEAEKTIDSAIRN
ncbi:MAG: CarD family transcriptional regulator [Eubacteriaceae bacterium]|nr:CarD family transcriptional regulator [Eubacteriaceae bacterium]MBR0384098.1 CarD family transcriptional regulator [Eubacteriaceae bacterium]